MTTEEAILLGLHVNDLRRIELLRNRLMISENKRDKMLHELQTVCREIQNTRNDLEETQARYVLGLKPQPTFRVAA